MKFKSCKLSMIDKLRYWFFDLWYNRVAPIFKKSNLEIWAEKEVKLAIAAERKASGVDKGWDYGSACYKSALRALKSLEKDGHSGFSIQMTKSILNRMIDWKPLTPIEDTPDVWNDIIDDHDGNITLQCSRMSSLFKRIHKDGTVSYSDNDHSVCVDISNKTRYHSGLVSKIIDKMYPITMPYIPSDKPIEVYCTDLLTDRKNGDFDTVGIFYCIEPNGKRVEINRYFKEGSSSKTDLDEWTQDWTEIDEDEWYSRIGLDMKRKLNEEVTDEKET